MATPGNALDIKSSGLVKFDGTATFSAVTTTNHDVLVGAASNGITNVAPSATSGIPLVSNGASSDPSFTTAVVAGGGTGNTTQTAYSIVCGGTTTTGAFQAVSSVASGSVLTSAGTSALPAWANSNSVGNWVQIETHTVSSAASAAFTNAAIGSATYISYVMVCTGVLVGTANDDVYIQISTDGGSTYKTSGYQSGYNYTVYNSATWTNRNTTSGFYINAHCNNLNTFSEVIWISGLASQLLGYPISGAALFGQTNGNAGGMAVTSGAYTTSSTAVNALRVIGSSGNITGTFTLYGIPA